jgi:hypothetical protein
MLSETYGKEAMKKSSVSEWHRRFEEGRENVEDDETSGRTGSHRIDENVEKVRNLVHWDGRLGIRALAVQLNLDQETVR